jgi:hypothetical protein
VSVFLLVINLFRRPRLVKRDGIKQRPLRRRVRDPTTRDGDVRRLALDAEETVPTSQRAKPSSSTTGEWIKNQSTGRTDADNITH